MSILLQRKRVRSGHFAGLVAVFSIVAVFPIPLTSGQEEIEVPDSGLRKALDLALRQTRQTFPGVTAESLKLLDASRIGIVDITGISALSGLTHLDLSANRIQDLSPLAQLPSLKEVYLNENDIVDLRPLSNLSSLVHLELRHNRISDLSPLSALGMIQSLDLSGNEIVELRPLQDLRSLRLLNLTNNRLSDIHALHGLTQLRWLWLSRNNVTPLEPLAEIPHLVKAYLDGNRIETIEPLLRAAEKGAFGPGSVVSLAGNPLQKEALEDLDRLRARGTKVLYHLEEKAGESGIEFESPELEHFIRKRLGKNQMESIGASEVARLSNLDLGSLSDRLSLKGLESCTGLLELNLSDNGIVDISPLASLTQLTRLHLSRNAIAELEPLREMEAMQYLDLEGNRIRALDSLSGLQRLKYLNIGDNPLSDISAIDSLESLEKVRLKTSDSFTLHEVLEQIPSLLNRNVEVLDRRERVILPSASGRLVPDRKLENTLRSIARQGSGELTLDDLEKLKKVQGLGSNFHFFNGIEYCVNLEVLAFPNTLVKDLSPLLSLKKLRILHLEKDPHLDPTPIGQLNQLEELSLAGCGLESIEFLRTLTLLEVLNLEANRIKDVSHLADLKSLKRLNLGGNQVSDLGPIANAYDLFYLDLYGNPLVDYTVLLKFPALRNLYVGMEIHDLPAFQEVRSALKEKKVQVMYYTEWSPGSKQTTSGS